MIRGVPVYQLLSVANRGVCGGERRWKAVVEAGCLGFFSLPYITEGREFDLGRTFGGVEKSG